MRSAPGSFLDLPPVAPDCKNVCITFHSKVSGQLSPLTINWVNNQMD